MHTSMASDASHAMGICANHCRENHEQNQRKKTLHLSLMQMESRCEKISARRPSTVYTTMTQNTIICSIFVPFMTRKTASVAG